MIEHILKLQGYIQNMQHLQVDNQEYAYLKALLLFSPGKFVFLDFIAMNMLFFCPFFSIGNTLPTRLIHVMAAFVMVENTLPSRLMYVLWY